MIRLPFNFRLLLPPILQLHVDIPYTSLSIYERSKNFGFGNLGIFGEDVKMRENSLLYQDGKVGVISHTRAPRPSYGLMEKYSSATILAMHESRTNHWRF